MVLHLPPTTPPCRGRDVMVAVQVVLQNAGVQFSPREIRGDEPRFISHFRFSGQAARAAGPQQLYQAIAAQLLNYAPAMRALLDRLRAFSPEVKPVALLWSEQHYDSASDQCTVSVAMVLDRTDNDKLRQMAASMSSGGQ